MKYVIVGKQLVLIRDLQEEDKASEGEGQ